MNEATIQQVPQLSQIPRWDRRARIYAYVSLALTFASLFFAYIAFVAIVFAILAIVRGEKTLGFVSLALAIIYFICVFSLNVYIILLANHVAVDTHALNQAASVEAIYNVAGY